MLNHFVVLFSLNLVLLHVYETDATKVIDGLILFSLSCFTENKLEAFYITFCLHVYFNTVPIKVGNSLLNC